MEQHFVSQKSFRYFTSGNAKKATKLLVVLHGYGQLAEYFIRKFNFLSEDYFIVAPEGMHRFYLKGSSGRVGASWMTKEDRNSDIQDNLNWLTELVNYLTKHKSFDSKAIIGFSQGGATASRWVQHKSIDWDTFIAYASVYPPDLSMDNETNNSVANYFVIGNEDEYFDESAREKTIEEYQKLGFTIKTFDGKHDINQLIISDILTIK